MKAPFMTAPDVREIRHFHLFCGSGSGAAGMNDAKPSIAGMHGRFRCVGGIDVDAGAIRDFTRFTDARGTVLDLFDRGQYLDFHGEEPPASWREATPDDIRRAAGNEHPHIVFLSAPCKGFSGLMAEGKSKTAKYQALNRLTLRGVWLMLEAFGDDPPDLIAFENVPRIATRGRHLLDQIVSMLRSYGYAVAETTHDCGRIGGLAQSRKRFLLVARHAAKVPPFLYEPPQRPLRGVGEVLGRMLLPGDAAAGPMHRVPRLSWKTWVRLAFVEAGRDWRSLNRLAVEDGALRDFLIVPTMHNGTLGVQRWEGSSGTVTGNARAMTGAFSVADPRPPIDAPQYQQYGVLRWAESAGAVIGVKSPGQGTFAVADPRHDGPAKHCNEFRIVRWDRSTGAVTSAHGSGQCVADPRPQSTDRLFTKYPVTEWGSSTGTVIGGDDMGAYSVADPRMWPDGRDAYSNAGNYGVVDWSSPAGAVSSSATHDNGRWSIADPRMPAATEHLVAVIRALDGTWHRPFTTLELAALQGMYDPERDGLEPWTLDGSSDSVWREHIGNAVPREAARAIGEEFGRTLLLAMAGDQTFHLSDTPIWVRPVAVALALAQGDHA